jgi:two-component system sensor histidine kinase RegB
MRESTSAALTKLFSLNSNELRSSPRIGLQRLLILRALVTAVTVSGAVIFDYFSPLDVSTQAVAVLLAAIIISVLIGWRQVRSATLISQGTLVVNMLLDFAFVIVLLLYTGGAANPLISYLLVLLAVAATLLSALWANLFAVLAMAVYTAFLVVGIRTDAHGDHMMQSFQLHLVGMWVTFVVSAALITVFVSRMAAAIRSRELSLAKFRENEMRNEQLVAIGTLAAGTAHALGTPLSTMAVLLSELDDQTEEDLRSHPLKEDIHLLRQQVVRCKASLDQLTRFYNKNDQQHPGRMRLDAFQNAISDYIVNIHPRAQVQFNKDDGSGDWLLSNDITVRHALINIIENAIRAAQSQVVVSYQLDQDADNLLLISVQDDGPGIPPAVMENMGEPFISTREGNMGLGIFLANASIQRHGGTIEMFNLRDGGARTQIRLPFLPPAAGDSHL